MNKTKKTIKSKTNNKNKPIRPATAKRAIKNKKHNDKSKKKQSSPIVLLSVAILIITLLFIPGSSLWSWARNILLGLFSKGSYLLPIIFLYMAYVSETSKSTKNYNNIFRKFIYLYLSILTLSQILIGPDIISKDNFIDYVYQSFYDGLDKTGGGLVAAIIAWPFLTLLGFGGSISLISIFIFILVMIISKITLTDLLKAVYSPAKKIETIYNDKISNKHKKTNIDIPLDNFPPHPVESTKSFTPSSTIIDNQTQDVKTNQDNIKFIELNDLNNQQPITTKPQTDKTIYETINIPIDLDNETTNTIECKPNPTKSELDHPTLDQSNNSLEDIDALIQNKMNDNKNSPTPNYSDLPNSNNNSKLKENLLSNLELSEKHNNAKNNHTSYTFPSTQLLKSFNENNNYEIQELKNTAQKLVDTLKSFGVSTKLLDFSQGPAVTRYELQPASGVKISKITGLADDIALNLAAAGVRIEAPIPNKAAVGIEIPNKNISIVGIKSIIDSPEFKNSKSNLAVALGKDISGNIAIADIAKMPHILIAGSTGSGKSVCINSIIISLIFKSSPDDVRLLMVDPKVVELGVYNDIPHLLIPVVTDPKKAAGALNWAVSEMLNRYKIFADTGVRDLKGYNALAYNHEDLNPLPQIVIIIDELADLMMVAPNEIEDSICRLAQMARAAGMHLVIATQRPSVDVITGIIKANIPSRIAFAVSSQVDSRTIIDSSGAEKLLGRGDMLFYPMGAPKPIRVQGCFVSDKEVESVVQFIKNSYQADYDDEISQEIERLSLTEKSKNTSAIDEIFSQAVECAIDSGEISTSYLQRKLKLGYSRAARLIDQMESQGIVGPKEGSKPRKTLISRQDFIEMTLNKKKNTEN